MHTPSPPTQEPALVPCSPLPPSFRRRERAGFSLVEVTLAIAIVAFAFVALIGLLPAGLGVFNQTMDSSNEMRITSELTSMIQATNYDNLTNAFAKNVYYFDVDGGALDTKGDPKGYDNERIYSAKVVFDDQYVQPTNIRYERKTVAVSALILIGKYNETINNQLDSLNSAQEVVSMLKQPAKGMKIRVFPMLVSKTDGLK